MVLPSDSPLDRLAELGLELPWWHRRRRISQRYGADPFVTRPGNFRSSTEN
jgi:hypothetical protein